ncbi:H+ transporting ATP synthase subunit d [Operophtera brumata]|uniref:H+ transporting ATP synthase subunit d n=1 Tax=Operophtera brumata TaxID=104452 RepID=A0A0L7K3S3_OPEBR|nr:H+ transporting ATP synthase subunit d [Operophtera brumata]
MSGCIPGGESQVTVVGMGSVRPAPWAPVAPPYLRHWLLISNSFVRATKELARVNALPKLEEMTMEMFYDMYPDQALDPVKRPSFWPHTADEQEGYVEPVASGAAAPAAKKGTH